MHDIPFFCDLPTKVIPATAKLWDAAKAPAYNGMAAYANFVEACNDHGIAPPARALVKRFVAGVQCGRIERPGSAQPGAGTVSVAASAKAYFENLPETATASVQAAYDKAIGGLSAGGNFSSFCKDLNALNYSAPTRGEFGAWLDAVARGEVERPARQIETETVAFDTAHAETSDEFDPEKMGATVAYEPRTVRRGTVTMFGSVYEHSALSVRENQTVMVGKIIGIPGSVRVCEFAADAASPGTQICIATDRIEASPWQPMDKGLDERKAELEDYVALLPADFARVPPKLLPANMLVTPLAEVEDGVASALREARDRMIDAAETQLRAGLRRQAELLVAAQLRAMAAQMAGEAA